MNGTSRGASLTRPQSRFLEPRRRWRHHIVKEPFLAIAPAEGPRRRIVSHNGRLTERHDAFFRPLVGRQRGRVLAEKPATNLRNLRLAPILTGRLVSDVARWQPSAVMWGAHGTDLPVPWATETTGHGNGRGNSNQRAPGPWPDCLLVATALARQGARVSGFRRRTGLAGDR